jgi:putative Ca2+/H+ antiporter (TMEM165/GDT1 family)
MNPNTSVITGWLVTAFTTIFGLLVVTGVIWGQAEKSTRYVLGSLFIIFGIYRLVTLLGKRKAQEIEEKRDEIREKTEKLLRKK